MPGREVYAPAAVLATGTYLRPSFILVSSSRIGPRAAYPVNWLKHWRTC